MTALPSLKIRAEVLAETGKLLCNAASYLSGKGTAEIPDSVKQALQHTMAANPWFTADNLEYALRTWSQTLTTENISAWIEPYSIDIQVHIPKKVAIVMAGNIPLVGFHDFISVFISGNSSLIRLSGDDKILLPALAEELFKIEPASRKMVSFTEQKLCGFDAVIATGSNNTARYFEYYFSAYPHIIRRSRNGVAVLSGKESPETLASLGEDICRYFGMGCRSVSKIFVPERYDIRLLFDGIRPYRQRLFDHFKYMNNYTYRRSVFMLDNTPHFDDGVLMLCESSGYSSPISVLYYQYFENIDILQKMLQYDNDRIQCIATEAFAGDNVVLPGKTQQPELAEYADGVNTLEFLTSI